MIVIVFELAAFNAAQLDRSIGKFVKGWKRLSEVLPPEQSKAVIKIGELRRRHPEYDDLNPLTAAEKMAENNPGEYQQIYETLQEMHKRALEKRWKGIRLRYIKTDERR